MKLRTSLYAELLGVSISTIYRWLKAGRLPEPERTFGNHRRFEIKETETRKTILYARVSSAGQKEDLERQKQVLKIYSPNGRIIHDIGSGLNFKKPGFTTLINLLVNKKIDKIVVQNKDRLSRFGFSLIEAFASIFGTEIQVINQEQQTFEAALVSDLMALIASFSGSIYGKRSHKNKEKLA